MRRTASLSVSLALALGVVAAPAAAAPPERFEDPIYLNWADLDQGKVVFVNITRDDLCDWIDSGFAGPPPVVQPVPVQFNETPTGAVVAKFTMRGVHIEMFDLDEDADLSGPCDDTDDSPTPWATGTANAVGTDNDLFHDASIEMGLHRANAFGDQGQAQLRDSSGGRWHYSWTFKIVGKQGEPVNFQDRSVLVRR